MISFFICSLFFYILSFPNFINHFGYWPCAWFFAVPLFFVLDKQSARNRLWIGLSYGVLSFLMIINWFIPYSLPGYLLFVIVLSSQIVIFALFFHSYFQNKILNVLYLPALWVTTEYLRSFLMSGHSWNLGHSQSFNIYAIQMTDLFGSYGLSFVIILLNNCVYELIKRPQKKRAFLIIALSVVVLVFSYGIFSVHFTNKQTGTIDSISVLTIQPDIDFKKKLDKTNVLNIVDKQIAMTQEAAQGENFDLIVWPETSVPEDFRFEEPLAMKLLQLSTIMQTPLLIGAVTMQEDKQYNSVILFESTGNIQNIYHKRYLVPFSEYIPEGIAWQGIKKVFRINSYDFAAGSVPGLFALQGQRLDEPQVFGAAVCSEDNIGSVFREYARLGAQFVIVVLNDAWFDLKPGFILHTQNAIMHAVENRLPIIRASNNGWTCIIDKYGRVQRKSLKLQESASFRFQLQPNNQKTFYNIIGDTFCGICMCFVIMNFIWGARKRVHDKKRSI